jgi:hypothetical protein
LAIICLVVGLDLLDFSVDSLSYARAAGGRGGADVYAWLKNVMLFFVFDV